jgi:hypothetical protein
MKQIDQDHKAVEVRQQYVTLLGLDENKERPILDKKIELCSKCHKAVKESIANTFKKIHDALDKSTQQLIMRLK